MKLTEVYISLDCQRFNAKTRTHYAYLSNYLSLFISHWIKRQKLDLGFFNRIIFEEGEIDDLSLAGDRAFVVCLSEEFFDNGNMIDPQVAHRYFVRKYLEGFKRFDAKFGLQLAEQLQVVIENQFSDFLEYEIKAKSKRLGDLSVQVFHQYKCNSYELIVRIFNKQKDLVKEDVAFMRTPDPISIEYDVDKIEIEEGRLRIISSVGEETIMFYL